VVCDEHVAENCQSRGTVGVLRRRQASCSSAQRTTVNPLSPVNSVPSLPKDEQFWNSEHASDELPVGKPTSGSGRSKTGTSCCERQRLGAANTKFEPSRSTVQAGTVGAGACVQPHVAHALPLMLPRGQARAQVGLCACTTFLALLRTMSGSLMPIREGQSVS
jgi:hypothetical protein